MDKFSYLSNATPEAIDALYQQFLATPDSLEEGWKKFFEGFEFARINYDIQPGGEVSSEFLKEFKVMALINGYRQRGHLFTQTNPVVDRRKYLPTLDIENFGLDKNDLGLVFQAGNEIGIGPASLQKIMIVYQIFIADILVLSFYMYVIRKKWTGLKSNLNLFWISQLFQKTNV